MMARTPDLSCSCSLLTSKPRRESISSWLRMRSAVPPTALSASLAGDRRVGVLGVRLRSAAGRLRSLRFVGHRFLLNDHFFEEDVADAIRRGGDVDPAQQFFLQAHDAGRALDVVHAQFAQIALELVDDARHQRLQAGFFVGGIEFERHAKA